MREFKVFVSSTFRDMYAERDVLHRQVSAILARRIAESELDCTVRFVDLRWGIDDRSDFADRSEFIIEKCFDSIRECDLFLCILGEKIGSPVEPEILARYSDLASDGEAHGYTELEIEYAKRHFDRSRLIFLCSLPTAAEEQGARRLKERIALDEECLEYSKADVGLGTEFISHSVNSVFDRISALSRRAERHNPYFRRDALIEKIEAARERSHAVLLFGENGTGKSALLDCLAIDYEARGWEVYLSEGLKKGINSTLPRDLSLWVGSEDERLSRDIEALKRTISKDRPVILIVDKIDDERPGDIFMLCRAFSELENVTVLMSLSDSDMLKYLEPVDSETVTVGALTSEEIGAYMTHIAGRYGKRLFTEVVEHVAASGEAVFGNALYLELLTDQLCIMDSAAYTKAKQQNGDFVLHIIDEMISLIDRAPRSIEELIRFKISDFDKYLNPEFSRLVVGIMAAYRSPIHLSTLHDVYEALSEDKWDDVNYYTLCYYLREFIVEVDEHLYYISPFVKTELEGRFFETDSGIEYEQAIYDSLSASGLDSRRLYFAALNLGKPEFYEDMTGEHRPACINALWSYFESEARAELSIHRSSYYDRLCKVIKIRGALVAVETLRDVLHLVSCEGNRGIVEYVRRSYRRIRDEVMDCGTRMKLCSAVLSWYNSVGLEHLAAEFVRDSLDLLVAPDFHGSVGKDIAYEDFFEFLYYVIVLLYTFDKRELIKNILSVYGDACVKVGLVRITPLFAEAIIRIDEELFVKILNSAEEPDLSDRELVGAYINVLKYRIYRAIEAKDTDTAYRLCERMYELARAMYEEEPSSIVAMYDYSQALGLYGFVHSGDREGLQSEMFDDMYRIRLILTYAQPDNRISIEGMSTCIVNIIRSDVKISVSTEQMLTALFERIRAYAERGNIQTGWLIVNLFRTLRENREALNVLRRIINEIGSFLEPIIVNTRGNTENLAEIIRAFLDVYHSYCEAQILPLDEGFKLLTVLNEYAVRLVALGATEESCALYHVTFRELITVLMQGSDFPPDVLKSRSFTEYERTVCAVLEKEKTDGARMLATTPDGVRILVYSMAISNEPHSMRIKVYELKTGGSLLKRIKTLVLKNYAVLKEYIPSGRLDGNYLQSIYLGAQIVKKFSATKTNEMDGIISSIEAFFGQ